MNYFTAIALFALIAAANSHGHCGRGGIGGGYSSLGGGSQYASQGYQAQQQQQQYSASSESKYAASDASVVDAGYGSAGYGGVGGVVGGGAYGAAASNNYAAQSQKQASYSKSVKYSASSASASSQYAGLTQYYPQLGGDPFFQNVYNLVSTERSQTCGKYFSSDFDYETSFNSWFSKNQYFSQYLGGATGFDFSQVSQRSQFYSLLKTKSSHSGSLVRAIRSFARHGSLYNSDFGRLLVTHSSTQLLQSFSQYQQYGAVQSWDQWGLSHLFKSKYYQSRITSFLGLQSFEYNRVSSALSNAFRTNFGGTLLGLRHLLLRRDTQQSFSWSNYQSISSVSVYDQYRSRFGYRLPYSSYLGGASSSAYGSTSAYSSDISSSSGYVSATDSSIVDAGYGGIGSYGAAAQQQSAYSKSVQYSSSSSASSQYAGLQQYYPQLGVEPFFQNVYNLVSTEKSQACGKYFTSDFDYETSFNSWFSKNQYFSQYLGGATGFDFSQSSQRSQFYSLLKSRSSQSGSLVRAIRSFARHGSLYNSDFGKLLVTHSSTQLLQSYSQYQQYGAVQSWDQWGLGQLFRSKYYQSRITSFLGLQSFEYNRVSSALSNAFRTNFGGTLLGLRHLLLRRDTQQSFSWSNYQSINSVSVYDQYKSRFGYRLPYNSYLGASSSAYGATSAYSSDISSSSYVAGSDSTIVDSSIGGVGYSGIGGAGYGVGGIAASSGAYGSQQQVSSSQYSRSSSSVVSQQSQYAALQQHYPVLGQDSFFQNVYGLVSVERSAQCGRIITQDFNFESTFSTLFSNQVFSNYFWQSIGIQSLSSVQDRTRLFGLIKSNPGFFVRSLRTFARHGAVYNSNFGKFLLENSSTYLFQNYQTVQRQYYSRESWSQWGLDSLLQSKYYQRKLATFFGLGSSYSYEVVSSRLQGFLQKNFASGLLALRHLVLRRDVGQYFNFRSYSRISSFKAYESWRSRSYRCPYYSAWNQASAASSSYQSAQSQSSYSRSSARSSASSNQFAGGSSVYGY